MPWWPAWSTRPCAASSAPAGRSDRIAGLDNFCWPDPVLSEKTPDGPYKLAQLVRANQALYDVTTAYGVPCISGKDSMKNDSVRGGRKISIPPTLLFSTIGSMDDVRARGDAWTSSRPGDFIYVVGLTRDELGASEYHRLLAARAGHARKLSAARCRALDVELAPGALPRPWPRRPRAGLLRSSHTPDARRAGGGAGAGAMGGDLGAEIDSAAVPGAAGSGRRRAALLGIQQPLRRHLRAGAGRGTGGAVPRAAAARASGR